MLFEDLANSGAAPALERMLRFAAARQRLLVHNIANIDTPDYRPMDVSPKAFQDALAKAVHQRRQATGGEFGDLRMGADEEAVFNADASTDLHPRTPSSGVLYHDRNNRDLERMMQSLAENNLTHRVAADLLRRHNELLRSAISQRV
ncbi:MAG: hypothetical protein JSR77_08780 [Planctomycetes bacterium]|nr:hypothetical protein [Planctomycetota bacterium]